MLVIFYARNQVSFNTDPTRFRFGCVLFVRLTLDLGVMAVLPLYFAFSAGLEQFSEAFCSCFETISVNWIIILFLRRMC